MSSRIHIKKQFAPKQGCCGTHASQSATKGASGQTSEREKHSHEKPAVTQGSCCCRGDSNNNNRSGEPAIPAANPTLK
jgi:hypothetical protein